MAIGFVTCGPNRVLVVSGCFHRVPTMIRGGRAFVWPIIQQCRKLPLKTMTLQIDSPTVYTAQGVPISVTGIAQVKIDAQSDVMLLKACEQFLGKKISEIENVARETLEGHQRAIMGSMTVEEIYKDRKKFSQNVYDVASADLLNMGIAVISYTLKDVRDDHGYLQALGMGRTAQVQRDARIGEAEARKDAIIKQAIAEEERMAAKYKNDIEIARAKRDYELKKAAYDKEVEAERAEAEMAYELQMAITQQRIREEKMQVEVVERIQDISVQDQEIQRRAKELEATVKRPAEAEKFRLEKLAHANHNRVLLEAEAEAEAIRLKGDAEAFALEAKGKAEAEQLARKADAYRLYEEAAVVEMMLEVLPKIVSRVAAPLSSTDTIKIVSTGGDIGISKLTNEIVETVSRIPDLTSTMTGVNVFKTRSAAQMRLYDI